MLPKKQVLIIEDNAINREMLRAILEDVYRVLEAENGLAALDVLSHHRADISLILLDVRMPVMDGYTFLDRIKKDAELALIPVIVMTQSDSERDEVAALSHGATDFVPKPYRPQVILHRAASLIKLRETAAMVNQFQFDRLTGLYTKEFFYQKVRERLVEDTGHEYTIICSNIENFKLYNDTFGREAGDRLLREYAGRFLEALGDRGLCGRYGADRFLFFQERQREREDRDRFFARLKREEPALPGNVSLKWGIYEITDRSIPIDQMCDRALLAADSAHGRYNQPFVIYDDTLRARLLREKALVDSMASALSQKQFTVYYQPKYGLKEERMAGAEALARWMHPELGFISPGEFIPLFEKNGFITRLDQYVWETVCQQLADWKRRGLTPVPVSVNISRADVCQADLAGVLSSITKRYGIDPSELHLEITESAYASHPESIISAVEALRALGFIVEMDDFGSGYSSLNMLSQMKLDILKLDMQFIQSEIAKPEDQSILHDVVRMAHRLSLGVVAEGVETKDQLEYLYAIGCDYLQGYYLARPMPVAEFEALLGARPAQDAPLREPARPAHDGLPTLLLADENEDYRALVRRTFRGNYHVVDVCDAADVLTCIAEDLPSAILLSTTLPGNAAGEVLGVLRQNPAYWHIPVLSLVPRCDSGAAASLPDTDDFLCRCHPQADLSRRVSRMIELSSARERESLLRDEANRDYTTGLRNRRGLQIAMDALRREDLPLALCLFDLDNLKQINDAHGREAGDRVIQSFADLLRSQTRDGDIRCRYDGNAFVVILRHIRGGEDALRRTEQICRTFRAATGGIPASCTAGIALCGIGDRPSGELLEQAEQALFYAKQENRGFCCLWPEKG